MLNFKPLKTKALKTQGNITRKIRTLNTGDLSLISRLTRHFSKPTLKILFDEL